MTLENSSVGLLISNDFLFTNKITGTAAALEKKIEVVASEEAVISRIQSDEGATVKLLLIDLHSYSGDIASLTLALSEKTLSKKTLPENQSMTIAFGPHVDADRLQAARDANCDLVIPRSRFSSTLHELLEKHL